jgi:hypothetical protein
MSIKSTPFFYIIEHILSGKKYGGAKWAGDANPATFMVEGGYTTSSTTVNDIIKAEGLGAFRTILIITDFGFDMSAYEYETVFLQTFDIANNVNWLNGHNNDGYCDAPYGTDLFYSRMLNKYGVKNAQESSSVKNTTKHNNLSKYGVEYTTQLESMKEKSRNTQIRNRGVDHHMKTEEGIVKYQTTSLENYGVEHPMKSQITTSKIKETCLELYGVENVMQNAEIKKSFVDNFNKKHGVDNPYQLESTKIKSKETCLELYGVEYYSQTQKSRENSRKIHTGKTVWNDGNKNYNVQLGKDPEPHWVIGFLPRKPHSPEDNAANSARQLGSKLWNDGKKNHRVKAGELPEPHWILGKIVKPK